MATPTLYPPPPLPPVPVNDTFPMPPARMSPSGANSIPIFCPSRTPGQAASADPGHRHIAARRRDRRPAPMTRTPSRPVPDSVAPVPLTVTSPSPPAVIVPPVAT